MEIADQEAFRATSSSETPMLNVITYAGKKNMYQGTKTKMTNPLEKTYYRTKHNKKINIHKWQHSGLKRKDQTVMNRLQQLF